MAIEQYFFDSNGGDRKYKSKDFVGYFALFVGDGVFPNPATGLAAAASIGMTVTLNPGAAFIHGHGMNNTASHPLTLAMADGTLPRIDRIVVRLDLAARTITPVLLKGIPDTVPAAPTLTRTDTVYDLGLATVALPAGTTAVTQSMITDTRFDAGVCGLSTMLPQGIDFTGITAQYQAAFEEWFAGVQGTLDGDTAGNLYNLITAVADRTPSLTTRISIPSGANLNAYTTPGSLACTSNATAATLANCPTTYAFIVDVNYAQGTPGYIGQTITVHNTGERYYRLYTANTQTWSAWRRDIAYLVDKLVDLTGLQEGDTVRYDGTKFLPAPLLGSGVTLELHPTQTWAISNPNSQYITTTSLSRITFLTGIATGITLTFTKSDPVDFTEFHNIVIEGDGGISQGSDIEISSVLEISNTSNFSDIVASYSLIFRYTSGVSFPQILSSNVSGIKYVRWRFPVTHGGSDSARVIQITGIRLRQ